MFVLLFVFEFVFVFVFPPRITIVPGTTYQVTMDPESWLSVFNVKFPANGAYAFFAEHMPSEFYFPGGTEMELLKDGELFIL